MEIGSAKFEPSPLLLRKLVCVIEPLNLDDGVREAKAGKPMFDLIQAVITTSLELGSEPLSPCGHSRDLSCIRRVRFCSHRDSKCPFCSLTKFQEGKTLGILYEIYEVRSVIGRRSG